MSDDALLREYVAHGSQTAFAQLVDRHVHLVYSTARRLFARRGRTLSASAIIGGISVGAVQAVPASLAPAVVAASVAAMGAAGTAYGLAQTLALMKTKLALAAVALAVAAAAPTVVQQRTVNRLRRIATSKPKRPSWPP
jgi:hypothetical protein